MNTENKENFEPASFPQKYLKKIQKLDAFMESIDSGDTEEIKQKIVEFEKHIYEIEQEKESNLQIQEAKTALKEMTGPFTESKGIETAKIKYCIFTLQNRGVKM